MWNTLYQCASTLSGTLPPGVGVNNCFEFSDMTKMALEMPSPKWPNSKKPFAKKAWKRRQFARAELGMGHPTWEGHPGADFSHLKLSEKSLFPGLQVG
jgi:hypothetical protein